MAIASNFPTINPTLNLSFLNAGRLDPRVTFTRASTATYFDQLGVLQSAANNVPRFDYNPSTLAGLGLLIEEQRTNSIHNNTMQGAVAGTPGTLPTNWVAATLGGLTREIVGIGTVDGITYIDLRYSGTPSVTSNQLIQSEVNTGVAALQNQTWTGSVWVAMVGGSTTNITNISVGFSERDSGGTAISSGNGTLFTPTSTLTRQIYTRTLTNAFTAFYNTNVRFSVTSGDAIDITLRIGLPQLELGAFATSVIPTTTTALTRSADVATMTGTNFSSWYNASEGTFVSQFSSFRPADSTNAFAYDAHQDSTNYISVRTAAGYTPDRIFPAVIVGGSSQFTGENTITTGYLSMPVGNVKNALAYKTNDFASSWNGVTPLLDTSGTLPTTVSLFLGVNGSQNAFLNGHIQRILYWPVRLANAQLVALTA